MEKQEHQKYQKNQTQFIYPVAFQDFVNFRRKQSQVISTSFNIKQLGKLRKLKKLLETTQQKICNRIKLFKKVSVNILKKKQKENQIHERLQNIKRDITLPQQQKPIEKCFGYMRTTKSSASLKRIKLINDVQKHELHNKKIQQIIQQKHDHAKQIKMWKQRNKIIVQQRRLKQMREKVQSANLIRNNRNRAKEIKFQCQQERLEQARKIKQQKFKQQIEKYDQLQSNLTKLQRQERQALILWKRAMEEAS